VIEVAVLGVLALAKVGVATLFVGKDKRISTSKTIASVWTLIVGAALFAMVYADLRGHSKPLTATDAAKVVGQYAVLFGGPLGAAILAKTIVTGQTEKDPTSKPQSTEGPKAGDLIANDAGDTDLGDLQYVLFNAVALFFVLGSFLHQPLGGLPHIPDVLLGLTSVSAVGYVGKKMLPNVTEIAASIEPTHAKEGEEVVLTLSGLPTREHPGMFLWVRFGPDDEGQAIKAVLAGHGTDPQVKVPDLKPAPPAPVPVTVLAEDGTMIVAGQKFTYDSPAPAAPVAPAPPAV